jgi:hypothetical protein
MSVQTASVLYLDNDTTVDSGTGIDIRLLSGSTSSTNVTQDCTATHTQDNVHRTFDPADSAITANDDPLVMQNLGWATRVTEDMTPSDDTNCNVVLEAQTLTVPLFVTVDQSGGTYVAGSYGPQWEVSLWDYDPVADTGTLIASGANSDTTWNYTPATGDIGTFKTVSVSVTISSDHEFTEGNILLLQIGLNTLTIPNPTLGTATWAYSLRIQTSGESNIAWESGKELASLCFITGSAAGNAIVSGAPAIVLPTDGSASGSAAVSGSLEADAEMTGTSSGSAAASGSLEADAEMTGTAGGSATVSGELGGVKETVGTVDIGTGGGTTVTPVYGIFE